MEYLPGFSTMVFIAVHPYCNSDKGASLMVHGANDDFFISMNTTRINLFLT